MFRHDAADDGKRVADELQRCGPGEAEDRGRIVGRLDGLQIGEDDAAEILQRLPDVERREGDIGGGEGLAVVPGHALAQMERHRKPVLRAFPGGGETRRQPILAVEGGLGERLHHLARHEEHAVGGDDGRIEVLRLGIGRHDQPAAGWGILCKAECRQGRGGQQRRPRLQEGPPGWGRAQHLSLLLLHRILAANRPRAQRGNSPVPSCKNKFLQRTGATPP